MVSGVSRTMLRVHELLGHEDDIVLGETGDLANIILKGGRAIGTLGHEEELQKLRRQMVPKKVRESPFSIHGNFDLQAQMVKILLYPGI